MVEDKKVFVSQKSLQDAQFQAKVAGYQVVGTSRDQRGWLAFGRKIGR
jgi:hypothetical protein